MLTTLEGKQQIATITLLANYKHRGTVHFPAVLSVPSESRLPVLLEKNYEQTLTCVAAGITMFLESEGVTDNMSVAIADAILNASGEDNLSVQDVLLFLQGLRAGKYGKFYGTPTAMQFMERFEEYRQERYSAVMLIREEQHSQHKAQGSGVYLPPSDTPGERLTEDQLQGMVNQIKNTYGEQPE